MITKSTTFILGAGASQANALPLGSDLYDAAKKLAPQSSLYQLLQVSGIGITTLNEMRVDMNEHPAPSIDAYLLTRKDRDEWVKAGKAMIAILMANAIKNQKV